MKNLKFLTLVIVFFIVNPSIYAQIRVNLKNKVENEANRRVNKKVDDAVNNTLDDVEGAIFGKKKDKENSSNTSESESSPESVNNTEADEKIEQESQLPQKPVVIWSKFDFVPGDKIIFEDAPSANEENGEFPSRWDLKSGVAEIVNVNGENVISFLAPSTEIVPYFKNPEQDYLPDIFTIEVDLFFGPGYSNRFYIYLNDRKNQNFVDYLTIYVNNISIGEYEASYPDAESSNYDEIGGWRHISIAYTKGKLKVYMDDVRLINIPHYDKNPLGLTVEGEMSSDSEPNKFLKNVRIAEGGVKYYDRAMQDGKIIVTGIRFDVGKATLKPESMGPINEIYDLMDKNPEINFSVEGHTDSDGNDETNQALSEERAKTVMNKLIEMGIDKSRLKSSGFGESKPIASNDSAEGKANNRRVEFVKF